MWAARVHRSMSAQAHGSTLVVLARWVCEDRPPRIGCQHLRAAPTAHALWAIDGDGCFQMTKSGTRDVCNQ